MIVKMEKGTYRIIITFITRSFIGISIAGWDHLAASYSSRASSSLLLTKKV